MSTMEKENKKQLYVPATGLGWGRKEQAGALMSCEMPGSRHLEYPKCEWTTL